MSIIMLFRDEKLNLPEKVHIHKEVCILDVMIILHIQHETRHHIRFELVKDDIEKQRKKEKRREGVTLHYHL